MKYKIWNRTIKIIKDYDAPIAFTIFIILCILLVSFTSIIEDLRDLRMFNEGIRR